MKVIVLGAGGRLGSRILAASVRAGHATTAFVRSKERLRIAIGELCDQVSVVEGDVADTAQLAEVMQGHEAAIQAAGYIGETYEEGKALCGLVASAVEAANEALVGGRRLWVLGGAGALDLPGRGIAVIDVPGFPISKYRVHGDNFRLLQRPEFATLDWSLACPGVMLDAPGSEGQPARVTIDELPVRLPGWAAVLPNALLLPAVAAIKDQLVGPSYEEVAAAVVGHLAPGGPLRHRRVGFASATAAPVGAG